jgi:hypothetical protein
VPLEPLALNIAEVDSATAILITSSANPASFGLNSEVHFVDSAIVTPAMSKDWTVDNTTY